MPLMAKLGWPTLFCHSLDVDDRGMITAYRRRCCRRSTMQLATVGFAVAVLIATPGLMARAPHERNAPVRSHRCIAHHVLWALAGIVVNDTSRMRTGDAQQNVNVVWRIVLNRVHQEPGQDGVKIRRFRATRNNALLERVPGI